MATNTIPQSRTRTADQGAVLTATDIAQAILAPLSSLRLTVVLLGLSVLVTFLITLQQSSRDMWEIKNEHFSSLMVEVPFQSIVVQRWFPDADPVPGSFVIPSGFTLIVLLLMNLISAHLLRFRLQASGGRLIGGLVVAAIGALFTWAIIFNTQSATTFQAKPPIPYLQMWYLLQGILGLLVAVGVGGFFMVAKGRRIEKLLVASLTLVVGIALMAVLLLGEKAFIGKEGMRIVWQLAQATAAGLVCLVAAVLIFRRKGGMVVLHLGIAGLLANEIYVSVTNEETQMQMVEGETLNLANDIRVTELAIIDQSDSEFDRIVVVPESKLLDEDLAKIEHPELPFNIEVLRFIDNADMVRKIPGRESGIASDGLFRDYTAIESTKASGVSSDQGVDVSAAWIRLTEKESLKPLGTYLVSQQGYLNDLLDTVDVGGKSYQIGLRFKTQYKPYALTLKDVQAKMYPGTETPSWYSSDFVLKDLQSETQSTQKVFMNNPLRYAGETFYQTGYAKDPRTGKEVSTLQIVKNKGWMIPYVCCMFVVVGLISQFGLSLLSFLEKRQKRNKQLLQQQTAKLDSDGGLSASKPTKKEAIWKRAPIAFVLTLVFALYGIKGLARTAVGTEKHESMRLDLLGKLPVTYKGRVQPLHSLARNTLRTLTKREVVYDRNNDKQSAIRWLADTMFMADGAGEYRLMRIEDPNILDTLDLPRKFDEGLDEKIAAVASESDADRKEQLQKELDRQLKRPKMRFTLEELAGARRTIRGMIPEGLKSKDYNQFQSRLSGVAGKIGNIQAIQAAFGGIHQENPDLGFETRINLALDSTRSGLPLLLPSIDPGKNWRTFSQGLDHEWVRKLAKRHDAQTYASLARKIVQVDVRPQIEEMLLAKKAAQSIVGDPKLLEVLKQTYQIDDVAVLAAKVADQWDSLPDGLREGFKERFSGEINARFNSQIGPLTDSLVSKLQQIGGLEDQSDETEQAFDKYSALFAKLGPAYRAKDADTFNSTLNTYLADLKKDAPVGYSSPKIGAELLYGGSSFFINAMVIFLAAFLVATFGWVGYSEKFNQASLWLLGLGAVFLITGLVFRIYISGRPPVTNLYSSVLFVTAIFVPLMMLVERMTGLGIGNVLGGMGAFLALMWAWTMSITDGDTFTVLMAVLDTQFWLATHVVCITIGYGTTFAAGALGVAYVIGAMLTPAFNKETRREVYNAMYGMVCLALLFSFFGTVLGGLWGDDSWGRFWGWDPKENGALMIVLWNAISLHARWGGMVKERGFAMIAIFGNIITLWSWKGVNVLGVGLHAYSGSEDTTLNVILAVGAFHLAVMMIACLPTRWWMSYNTRSA